MPTVLRNLLAFTLASFHFCATATAAELQLAGIFTDGAVLQRNASVPVWGRADPGQSIHVEFGGQKQTTTADNTGRWTLRLAPTTVQKY